MGFFEFILKGRSEPNGTCVSQPELWRLVAAQRQADATDIHAAAEGKPGLQLAEQQRIERMLHIRARLLETFGRARVDFKRSSRGHER